MKNSNASLGEAVLTGSLWSLIMRFGLRGLGLVSTLVLARLLVPADFGLVAMAMAVVTLANSLFDVGAGVSILRNSEDDRALIDSAWSIRLLQGLIFAMALTIGAGLIAAFYSEPRVRTVIYVAATLVVVRAAENPGVLLLRKEMRFDLDFRFNIVKKSAGVLVTVPLAVLLGDYRSLLIGSAVFELVGLGYSFVISSYRPRICWKRAEELWSFSKWLFLHNWASYILNEADKLIAGRAFNASTVGAYSVGLEIAQLPATELLAAANRALLPGLAKIRDDEQRFSDACLLSLNGLMLVMMPTTVGLSLVSDSLVDIVLGNTWRDAVLVLQFGALIAIAWPIGSLVSQILIIEGQSRRIALLSWLRAGLFLAIIYPLVSQFGILGLLFAKLSISVVGVPYSLVMLHKLVGIPPLRVLRAIARPVFATAAMCVVLRVRENFMPLASPFFDLGVDVVLGSVAVVSVVGVLWFAQGRPDSIESRIFRRTWLVAKAGTRS